MHDDAWYYVDVQRQGFFRIGSKLYFCDFFFNLKKNAFFKNVVHGVLISESICVMSMRCAKQRMLPNLPNNVFFAKF